MIDWDSYRDRMLATMRELEKDSSISPDAANQKFAKAIAYGYYDAVATGGDRVLKSPALLLPSGKSMMINSIVAGMKPMNQAAMISSICASVMSVWVGATLSCSGSTPLRGHVGHAPVATVLPTGVMMLTFPPIGATGPDELIDCIFKAMKAHMLGLTGIHPAMLLPSPAPPYPLPWAGYE